MSLTEQQQPTSASLVEQAGAVGNAPMEVPNPSRQSELVAECEKGAKTHKQQIESGEQAADGEADARSASAISAKSAEDEAPTPNLLQSAYQVAREANLKRNLEELRALGLLSDEDVQQAQSGSDAKAPEVTKAKRKKKQLESAAKPSRKSRRLRNQGPELGFTDTSQCHNSEQDGNENEMEDEESRESIAAYNHRITMERKIERLKALHLENETTYNNPTATYEHTWLRVRTMKDAALKNRVKAIERACGQHCIVKMRMFAEVLIIANKPDLAQLAEEALARLWKLVGKPDTQEPVIQSDT
mmetsp:Transcript_19405/g.34588  ORF Transcript_19405/g.34588 Transcript_19405/m.34588 type:complete len:302 (+) Transcript_19405:83-988(+)